MSHPGVPVTLDRLEARTELTADGCRLWRGAITPAGYGVIGTMGKVVYVHRAAYELMVGPIPVGFPLDHLCRHRACWEPTHLEAVTHAVNILRGHGASARHSQQTHCIHGHSLEDAYRYAGTRTCRPCRVARSAADRQRKKEENHVNA